MRIKADYVLTLVIVIGIWCIILLLKPGTYKEEYIPETKGKPNGDQLQEDFRELNNGIGWRAIHGWHD
jgi:hypothetical protein